MGLLLGELLLVFSPFLESVDLFDDVGLVSARVFALLEVVEAGEGLSGVEEAFFAFAGLETHLHLFQLCQRLVT